MNKVKSLFVSHLRVYLMSVLKRISMRDLSFSCIFLHFLPPFCLHHHLLTFFQPDISSCFMHSALEFATNIEIPPHLPQSVNSQLTPRQARVRGKRQRERGVEKSSREMPVKSSKLSSQVPRQNVQGVQEVQKGTAVVQTGLFVVLLVPLSIPFRTAQHDVSYRCLHP